MTGEEICRRLDELERVVSLLSGGITVREENLIGRENTKEIKKIIAGWKDSRITYNEMGPCPYCGNTKPEIYQGIDGMFFGRCGNDRCGLKFLSAGRTREECIRLWNDGRKGVLNECRSEQERNPPDKRCLEDPG